MLNEVGRFWGSVRGLGTVPGFISLFLWTASLGALWLDHEYPEFSNNKAFRYFYTDYDTAKSVLSTVASASITTLGLVYSIVLVVFTTAAGNIGPRLLQRFTGDRANQFTAGLFGGTFLFSLTVLHQTDQSFVPAFSIACTFVLAGLSVLQLIYFVHTASISVTIDEEVAEIAEQLEKDIAKLVQQDDIDKYSAEVPERDSKGSVVYANQAGYITIIDTKALISAVAEHDSYLTMVHGPGDFIVPGQSLAQLNRNLADGDLEKFTELARDSVTVSKSRSPNSDVEFSVNLLIEIALRALSPGVNDTFTAVTCVDRISSALVQPVQNGLRDQIRADENGVPRLRIPGLTLEDLLNSAFHPFRRAAIGNVLMTKHILDALRRLYEVGNEEAQGMLRGHADLILDGLQNANLMEIDVQFITDRHHSWN